MASNSDKPERRIKTIGTHDGVFHCDEALACFMLKLLPGYRDAKIFRTRNPVSLNFMDIVVDVGATYDPKTKRYDHHQREFNETLHSVRPDLTGGKFNTIRLSSAGLVYAHYGLEVLTQILLKEAKFATSECLKVLYLYIYDGFVEELDAIDNGIPMYAEGAPRYKINTHLGARVHRLNPAWNDQSSDNQDALFEKAMELVGSEFVERVLEGFNVWWPARDIVKQSILRRLEVYNTGEIIVLNDRCSWKEHLYAIEEEFKMQGHIKFCIFHEGSSDTWRVQGVPVQPDSFICRVFLQEAWWGVRDEVLSDLSRINGSIFCHSSGFIGGNRTKGGAISMAINSLIADKVKRDRASESS